MEYEICDKCLVFGVVDDCILVIGKCIVLGSLFVVEEVGFEFMKGVNFCWFLRLVYLIVLLFFWFDLFSVFVLILKECN